MIRIEDSRSEAITRNLWNFDPMEKDIVQHWTFDAKKTLFDAITQTKNPIYIAFNQNNIPVCFFGVAPIRPGVGEIWVVRGECFPRYAKSVVKEARKFISELLESALFFRIEAAVKPEWEKWAQCLGMKHEHTCKLYDGYTDHEVYVRF